MKVQAIPLTDFVHGDVNAFEGRAIAIEEALANDFERRGLVRVKMAPAPKNKMLAGRENKAVPGKALDDGEGPPSSALPVAPASRPTTLHVPARGKDKHPKSDT